MEPIILFLINILIGTILGTILGWYFQQIYGDYKFRKSVKKIKNIDDYYKELALSVMTSEDVEILNLRDAPLGKNWNEEERWRGEYFDIERKIISGEKPREIFKNSKVKKELPFFMKLWLYFKNKNKLRMLRRLTTVGIRQRGFNKEKIRIPSDYPLKFQSIMEDFSWTQTKKPPKKYLLKVFEHVDFKKLDDLLTNLITNLKDEEKKCALSDIISLKNECRFIFNLLQDLKSHDFPTLMSVVVCDEKRVFLGFHKPYGQSQSEEFTYIIITESEVGKMFRQYFNVLWGSQAWTRPLIWEENDRTEWADYNTFKEINFLFYKEIWDRINNIKVQYGNLETVKGNLVFDEEVVLWKSIESITP